jgi:hypothetical protein
MTDPAFDELASAHLDGATTPAEEARIAADPALRERVEELRRVRAAVAALPPVDPTHREGAIAAALAAFAADEDLQGAPAPVRSLPTVAVRRGPSPRVVRALGAAAAIVLVALAVPLLGRLAWSGDDDDRAATFESTGTAIEGAPDAGGSLDRAVTSTTVAGTQDLGAFDDVADSFHESAPQQVDGESTVTERPAGGSCPEATADTATGGSEAANTRRATVAGEAVIVVVVPGTGTAPRTLRVFRADDCTLVAELPL